MKSRKNILVTAAILAVVLLLGGASWLLVRGSADLRDAQQRLGDKKAELDAFFGRNPFPCQENVKIEGRNRDQLRGWLKTLLNDLRKGQTIEAERSPATFMRRLGEARNTLRGMAERNGVVIADPAFGFERYAGGSSLPMTNEVQMLTRQLAIVESLSKTLFRNGVKELTKVTRDVFEAPPSGTAPPVVSGGGGVRPRPTLGGGPTPAALGPSSRQEVEEHPLYTRLRFGLEFKAREDAVWRVLNDLASHEMFVVVQKARIQKPKFDVVIPPKPETVAAAIGDDKAIETVRKAALNRAERTVSGKARETPASVTLDVDVYLFRQTGR
jgi:hypothetical protein